MREFLYVKTVAEEKSINRAAQKLYVSQPALTKFLHRLEQTLGYSLFTRTAQGISLTPYGTLYYQMACEILDVYQKHQKKIKLLQAKEQGSLTVGASWYVQSCFLADCINTFCKKYPSIQIQFIEASSKQLLTQMEQEGNMDLIFIHRGKAEAPAHSKYLFSLQIAEEPFYVAAPVNLEVPHNLPCDERGYAILPLDWIKQTPLVRFQDNQKIRKITDHMLEQNQVQPPGTVYVHGFPNALNLVASSYGNAILPLYYLQKSKEQGSQIEIYGLPPELQCGWILDVCYYRQLLLPGAVKTFLRIIQKEQQKNAL
jgi:DNA-binding transcriptional LysR family regulator